VVDRLAREWRVIAIDRPGFGYSARPKRWTWTPPRQAALLHRLLERIGAERPVVLGHSFSTLVALAYGLAYPDETAGLVLESGYYFPTARWDFTLFAAPAAPVVGPVLRHTLAPALSAMLLPKMVQKLFAPNPVPANFSRFPLSLTLRPGHLRADGEDNAVIRPAAAHMARHYRRLAVPLRILAGTADEVVTTSRQSVRLAGEIPHASIRIAEGVGHMLHHIRPDLVEDAVRAVAADSR
jgi:pimeloyl-ACP methyl ester carboxylesterase